MFFLMMYIGGNAGDTFLISSDAKAAIPILPAEVFGEFLTIIIDKGRGYSFELLHKMRGGNRPWYLHQQMYVVWHTSNGNYSTFKLLYFRRNNPIYLSFQLQGNVVYMLFYGPHKVQIDNYLTTSPIGCRLRHSYILITPISSILLRPEDARPKAI